MDHKKLLLITIGALLTSFTIKAQLKNPGSWTILNVKHYLKNKFSISTEIELRSLSLYDRFYYYEAKAGVSYSIKPTFSVAVGTGVYNTFNEGAGFDKYTRQKETRLWEQFEFDQHLSIIKIDHRLRIEQRFKQHYENLFRYRLNVSAPINKKKIEPKALWANVYDEVFLRDKVPELILNRFEAGLGYTFNKYIAIQSGWLRQQGFNDHFNRRKSYLLVSLALKI
ncbi:MAG: DUF2490 domain-containing protein [Ferruginibacter sp.]